MVVKDIGLHVLRQDKTRPFRITKGAETLTVLQHVLKPSVVVAYQFLYRVNPFVLVARVDLPSNRVHGMVFSAVQWLGG